MARDGSTGTYSRAVPPYVFDTIIDETAVNSEMDDIAAALTQSVSKDGQTTMTGNLKMGGNKLTNAGDASAQNEYATAGQVQKGTASYLLSIGGTANAITAVASFSMTAYTAGQQFIFVPTANNSSTTPTININAIGALTIKRDASAALVANDIVSGRPAKLYYNGTDMILLNPATVAASQLQVNSVATASIQDNAVTTAKINDKAVTLAKMDDLAENRVIVGNSSSRPAAVSFATASRLAGRGTTGAFGPMQVLNRGIFGNGTFDIAGIRVHSVNKTDVFSTTSTSFADITGLSITLTPKSSSSIFLLVFSGMLSNSTADSSTHVRFMRGATPVGIGDSDGSRIRASASFSTTSGGVYHDTVTPIYLDQPATAAEVTYKMQMMVSANTGYLNRNWATANTSFSARTIASLVVIEIEAGNQ